MRKVLLLLVAVLMVGAIYSVQAYSEKGSDAEIGAIATSEVQSGDEVNNPAVLCPANCPNHVDKDGQCDHSEACQYAHKGQGCSGHVSGGCSGHR